MSRRVLGPFNRVEGDLEVSLEIAAGQVQAAYVNSPVYRGFEQILLGKVPLDALVFVPRICGICSVSQSVAAAAALRQALGWTLPDNGRISANVLLAAENIADHLTHFYLFFMPDFARPEYQDRSWFAELSARFRALQGSAVTPFLTARTEFLRLMGGMAGKWPHTLAIQPGGSSRPIQESEQRRLLWIVRGLRAFLEQHLFADRLETVAALSSQSDLWRWVEAHPTADLARFIRAGQDLNLAHVGLGPRVLMSYGSYGLEQGHLWRSGLARWGEQGHLELEPLVSAQVREDVSHAWYAEAEAPQAPMTACTLPFADKHGAYSWCKAPRYAGQVLEVGALARQVVAGDALAWDLVRHQGPNVLARVVMRAVEVARLLPEMERWLAALQPGAPYCVQGELPQSARGVGLVEAARGSLGHWLEIRHGRIENYQIIPPTTWNFSPRDTQGQPGPLESALVGLPVGEEGPVAAVVQHVVRSFDPCMACTVH